MAAVDASVLERTACVPVGEQTAFSAQVPTLTGSTLDLDFQADSRPYATHAVHPFPAKFPPQLVRWIIDNYTGPGETICDPMVGSGTTMVEARLTGRHCLATEIDPLSRLIARVKATPLDVGKIQKASEDLERRLAPRFEVLRNACNLSPDRFPALDDLELPEFPRRDYWFERRVCEDLAVLRDGIAGIPDRDVRDFFLVVYSSVIITKGPSTVANALDIAHSRAHHVDRSNPPDVMGRFRDRLRRCSRAMANFDNHPTLDRKVRVELVGEDARSLPLPDSSVDAIVTSPPYLTAIEYPRGHKFSLWWIGDLLGVSTQAYAALATEYIGTEQVRLPERRKLAAEPFGVAQLDTTITALEYLSEKRAGQARRYFRDMQLVLAQILRVLKPDRPAVLIVGDSVIRGLAVPTHSCLAALAEATVAGSSHFVVTAEISRTIHRDHRQMPIKRGQSGDGMKTEYVLVLQRRSHHRAFGFGSLDHPELTRCGVDGDEQGTGEVHE